ncbi:hypothetical protein F2Q68_00032170 [Brassica cretica]|uniref:Uncharacterized protein n=1 Tax=Brassica cretica TaxID=69181 RepID=A0A8S9GHL6_BRACR|nr:hypothetical protein F2Q68_00032170 [Brassica cretica]
MIIIVGGKEFKFTWSRERGDLCDIYEEHQSGEDGEGLLIESGCAWRKLNVQRTLDESTTSHMKMRSVEAVQRIKSRNSPKHQQSLPITECSRDQLHVPGVATRRTFQCASGTEKFHKTVYLRI